MVPGAELVVGDTARKGKITIQLPRFDAQHTSGFVSVAGATILAAGIVPVLRSNSASGIEQDRLEQVGAQKVGIRVVGPPFVGDAVNGAGGVAND